MSEIDESMVRITVAGVPIDVDGALVIEDCPNCGKPLGFEYTPEHGERDVCLVVATGIGCGFTRPRKTS